jgi:hypothetical protein
MGSQDSAMFASNFDVPSFEPDDFYESFQAPKFHDFSAPEEPMDPDAFFMAQPGMFSLPPSSCALICLPSFPTTHHKEP